MAASVQGPEFDSAVVAELLGREAADVEERLDALERAVARRKPRRIVEDARARQTEASEGDRHALAEGCRGEEIAGGGGVDIERFAADGTEVRAVNTRAGPAPPPLPGPRNTGTGERLTEYGRDILLLPESEASADAAPSQRIEVRRRQRSHLGQQLRRRYSCLRQLWRRS